MFDNPFSMVVAIILIVTIGKVLRARYGQNDTPFTGPYRMMEERGRRGREARLQSGYEAEAENQRLREELKSMKERLAVLERLATDSNDSGARLDREIEKLRDRTPN